MITRALRAGLWTLVVGALGCRARAPAENDRASERPPVHQGSSPHGDAAPIHAAPGPDPFEDAETPFANQPLRDAVPPFRADPAPPSDRVRRWAPASHLDLAYTLWLTEHQAPHSGVGAFIASTRDGPALIDPKTGARLRSLSRWPTQGWLERRPGAALLHGESAALFLHYTDGVVHAYDPTDRLRFVAPLYTPSELARRTSDGPSATPPDVSIASTTGSVIVLSGSWTRKPNPNNAKEACEHIGLDAIEGRLLWRRKSQFSCHPVAASAGRVVLLQDSTLVCLEAATGRVLWEKSGDDPEKPELAVLRARVPLVANDKLAVLWGSRDDPEVVVVDVAHGGVVSRGHPFGNGPIELIDVLLHGPRLYALVERQTKDRRQLTLTSVDPKTAHVSWRAPGVDEWMPKPSLRAIVADDDAVFACTPDGILRGHDPISGAVLWSWGIGDCLHLDAVRADAAAPATLLALGPEGLHAFARGTKVPPTFAAVVSGSISYARDLAIPVRVGPHVVNADARGRFRADVRGRGTIRVEPWLGAACERCSELLRLDGTRARFELSFHYLSDGP